MVRTKALLGAFAGIAGTAAMTATMRLIRARLSPCQRYPLPPRELTASIERDRIAEHLGEAAEARATDVAHFLYGATTGALYAQLDPEPGPIRGAGFGILVWAASYLGWIPLAGFLKPAHEHPAQRNGLMIAAHIVWGAATGAALADMLKAERDIFAGRHHPDRPDRSQVDQGCSG